MSKLSWTFINLSYCLKVKLIYALFKSNAILEVSSWDIPMKNNFSGYPKETFRKLHAVKTPILHSESYSLRSLMEGLIIIIKN